MFQGKKTKVLIWIILIQFFLQASLLFITVNLYTNYINTKNSIEKIINFFHDRIRALYIFFEEQIINCVNFYIDLEKIFTNRELALGFWLIVIIIFSLWKIDKGSLGSFIKSIFNKKILILVVVLLLYFLMLIFILEYIGFWETRLWKIGLIWLIFAGISISFRAIMKAKNISYFVAMIKDNLTIFILIQFVVNLYSLSFILEVIIVFITSFLTLIKVILETRKDFQDKNYRILKNAINFILGIIGLFLLIYSAINYLDDFQNINYIEKLKDLLLPPILSLLFIPYMYFFVLYSNYEVLFIRLSFKKTINENIRKYLYFRIILFCNINISKINNFIQGSKIMTTMVQSKNDVRRLITNYKSTNQ
ncbi:hypothetical protein PB01_15315 [Psychrobacillus glaciei]|uniref:Uncharacterized protein n=1 Tax=Psychrobacillus glaciei TaxID=2283160 RepID=A0A5J6ST58_9BACI|nr:hypothetical protein [Psychrobacillus glaciei]QFG00085.1 hypothetical protein PB01_15315 [Psychrobacillus glaciei]